MKVSALMKGEPADKMRQARSRDAGLPQHEEPVPAGRLLRLRGVPLGPQRRGLCSGHAAVPQEPPGRRHHGRARRQREDRKGRPVRAAARSGGHGSELRQHEYAGFLHRRGLRAAGRGRRAGPGFAFSGCSRAASIPPALLAALQAQGLPFTAQAVIFDADLSGNRMVRDKKVVCKLTPGGGGNWVIRRLRQTHGTPAERAAGSRIPERSGLYNPRHSEFAFRLPFDLFHQETRAYFERFDISAAELMRALRIPAGPQDSEIAAEELGLSDEERQADRHGRYPPIRTPTGTQARRPPPTSSRWSTPSSRRPSSPMPTSKAPARSLQWINPTGALFIRHLDNSCSLTKKEIRNLDAPALDRFHRFIRLWKKTGWTPTAIDRMIRAAKVGNGDLNDACLVRMQQMARLSGKLGLQLDEMCNFYDAIPAEGDTSRYARIFLNLAANGTIEEDFRPENVHQNELDEGWCPGSGKKLAAYKSYLALCLGAKPADSDLLVDSLGAAAILSAANIAAVYALNLLARKLRLSAAELLILRGLTGIDILASPADTLRFIEKADEGARRGREAGRPAVSPDPPGRQPE